MEVINEKQKRFAINFIMYIFAFIIIFCIGIKKSLAMLDYNNLVELKNTTVLLATSDMNSSSPINISLNTTYQLGGVRQIDYVLGGYNFQANTNYQLESHLLYQTLDKANSYSVQGYNGESCVISYENSIFQDEYPRWAFQCPHASDSITITIYNSNIIPGGQRDTLWSGTSNFAWGTALLKSSSTSLTGGSSSGDTDTIINNQNQNTQNIINNQNQNTQNIINSNKVCTSYASNSIIIDGKYLNLNGNEGVDNTFGITDYIEFKDLDYTFSTYSNSWIASTCFYNSNKELISCTYNQNLNSFNIPTQAYYLRMSIKKTFDLPLLSICQNGNQALNDSINNLDDTINDDDTTDAENEASDFFSSFDTETFGLTSIITAPLNLIRSVIGDGSICSTLRLPLPYLDNKYLELPCMYGIYSQYFGSFFTIYQTITYGIVAYWVIVRIFNQVKDFKNPEHDEIEVMDL